jgi:hypothetical protein
MISLELRRWRKAVRPRGIEVMTWMQAQSGSVQLGDDDAAAVAEYVRWLGSPKVSVWDVLFHDA